MSTEKASDLVGQIDEAIRRSDSLIGRAVSIVADECADSDSPESLNDAAEITRLAGQLRCALLAARALAARSGGEVRP